MKRSELGDLVAFLTVAEEHSFTRAAARLGTSQSALSEVVRRLEERLDVRLLTRTTRSVMTTEAGTLLAATLPPAFDDIEARLADLDALRSRPAGNVRITTKSWRCPSDPVAGCQPAHVRPSGPEHRDFCRSASGRHGEGRVRDAGVRLGEQVDKDMVAVRIGPDMEMFVAGSPEYFRKHPPAPRTPHDLVSHVCINIRLPTLGGVYSWEFEKRGRPLNVRVSGQFTCNDADIVVDAALNGLGLACLPGDYLEAHVQKGRLTRVLADWWLPAVSRLSPLLSTGGRYPRV